MSKRINGAPTLVAWRERVGEDLAAPVSAARAKKIMEAEARLADERLSHADVASVLESPAEQARFWAARAYRVMPDVFQARAHAGSLAEIWKALASIPEDHPDAARVERAFDELYHDVGMRKDRARDEVVLLSPASELSMGGENEGRVLFFDRSSATAFVITRRGEDWTLCMNDGREHAVAALSLTDVRTLAAVLEPLAADRSIAHAGASVLAALRERLTLAASPAEVQRVRSQLAMLTSDDAPVQRTSLEMANRIAELALLELATHGLTVR